jgi:methylmalonyl-CoA epimerase
VAPRTEVPGLIDPEGYLWHEVPQVYAKAKPEEAYIEARAQVRKALDHGVDVTHLDSHMGTLQLHPAFVEQYLKLAVEFDLPVRMASQETLEKNGGGIHHLAWKVDDCARAIAAVRERGVRMIDEAPRPGAHGCSIAFVHPKSTGGVLLELSTPPSSTPPKQH